MTADKRRHAQQTLLGLGDEFLLQYLLCAPREVASKQILSRLFSMGHSLELYANAALVDDEGHVPDGHAVHELIAEVSPTLSLTPDEVEAGRSLFRPGVRNFDMGIWLRYRDALELYQAQYFVRDLKYYLDRTGEIIFPVRTSLTPLNPRYLELVRNLRNAARKRAPQQDEELVQLAGLLGFEVNPAIRIVAKPQ